MVCCGSEIFFATGCARLSKHLNREGSRWDVKKEGGEMTISKELLDILACPKCKGDLHLNDQENGLICDRCRLLYEIKDGIPIMLIEEAKPL